MSQKRNSVFSAVVPVLGSAQTTEPIPLSGGSSAHRSQVASGAGNKARTTADPTVRYSTGSTLLDSFVQDAEYDAFTLQTELTALSYELKRIADPRFRAPAHRAPTQSRRAPAQSRRAPAQNRRAPAQGQSIPTQRPSRDAIQARQRAIAQARQQAQQRAQAALQQAKQLTDRQAQVRTGAAAQPLPNQAPSVQPISNRPISPRPAQASPLARHGEPTAPIQPTEVKVYGGADYKAMQARAQAGGLVNLEDTLLFGGTEQPIAGKKNKSALATAETDFLVGLSQPLEDFTCSPIPGGWHPTAHLSEAIAEVSKRHQTVLDIDCFKLDELETESLNTDYAEELQADVQLAPESVAVETVATEQVHRTEDEADEMAVLDTLGKQVSYLNQRIEFLSKKLAAMTSEERAIASETNELVSNHKMSSRHRHHSVVPGIEAFTLSEDRKHEKRLATLDSLVSAI